MSLEEFLHWANQRTQATAPCYRPVRIRSISCFTVGMKPFE